MTMQSQVSVIYPKTIPETYHGRNYQNCFLLGPIRNAPPWHEDAIDTLVRLSRNDPQTINLRINCPKRKQDMERNFFTAEPPSGVEKICARQREWEFDTQEKSVLSAGLLFWLPAEGRKEFPDKVYGAITQVEFGYWLGRAQADPRLRIAFGTDGVYNGELYTLFYDIERCAPWLLPKHTSLESLCAQAITWAKTPA